MNKTAQKILVGIIGFGICSSIPNQVYAEVCVVWDPGDTSANVRYSPNGRYQTTLENGTLVEVVGYRNDNNGRPWASIVQRGSAGNSFVIGKFVRDCIPGGLSPDGRIVR